MSESQSTPEQGAAESSNAPTPKAKPILRSKESGDQERSNNRDRSDKPERGGNQDRGKAKGKGRDRRDQQEPQAKVNAALMRGPRPTQPKPAPEPVLAEESGVTEDPASNDAETVETVSEETVEAPAEAE